MVRSTRLQVIGLALASLLGLVTACSNTCSDGSVCGDYNTVGPGPAPTAAPTGTPSPTPSNECGGPVQGVRVSGTTEVKIGSELVLSVTPVSSAGPLEGALDYCNAHRSPTVERASANLRCIGACGGWAPRFLAVGLGPFEVQIRVDGAVSPVYAGTVVQ